MGGLRPILGLQLLLQALIVEFEKKYHIKVDDKRMISLQSDKPNEQSDDSDDSLQTFSKTCSIMYGKISKKQYEYLQAMTVLQEDIFDSCSGLIKEQVDMLEEYTNRGIVSKEYMMPVIGMANRLIESYLNYVSRV